MTETKGHRWRFFRAGGVDQPRLDTGADLLALEGLDQKLWVALSCPVKGLEFDERTLALLDTDNDGRVRALEVLAALRWTAKRVKSLDGLVKESAELSLSAIDDSTPEGKAVLASARQVLTNLGKAKAESIAVEDLADTAKIFGQTRFNGDGVITPETAEDAAVRKVVLDIISTHGAVPDRSGAPGIDAARVESFFADAAAYAAWRKRADEEGTRLLPLGDATAEAHRAYVAIKPKVDDYFARCRLAAYDARALAALNRQESDYLALAARDFTISAAEVSGFPLARVEAGKDLPLGNGVNPAWSGALEALRKAVVAPLLGKEKQSLTAAEWTQVGDRLGPYADWMAAKAGAALEPLGIARVRELLGKGTKEKVADLIARDRALEAEAKAIGDVERLVRYHRDLHRLLVNFVSFEDFYSRRRKAVFQAGTLYLDGRSCDLCIRVDDAARHGSLAPLSKTYLAYCDCVRPGTGEKMTIAAAFTGGDSDHLMVGRNGIFYDRKGNDWDATISKVVENPISIRQAFWSPYKRFVRWIEDTIAKRAAEADTAAATRLTSGASTVGTSAQTGKAPDPKASKFDVGVVAALGVAVGGITAAFGAILQAFFGLGAWMPIGLVALVILISGPSMVIAWLKLRQRNIGPILDANGWAVNGRVRINVPFGGALTAVATLPPGARRSMSDPYAVKRNPWPFIFLVLVVLAAAGYLLNEKGFIHKWTGYGKVAETEKGAEGSEGVDAVKKAKAKEAPKPDAKAEGDAKKAPATSP